MSSVLESSASRYVEPDAYIDFQLQKTRAGVKTTDMLTAAVGSLTVFLGYLLAFVIGDHWLVEGGFGVASRTVLLGGVLLACGAWLVLRMVVPYLKSVNRLYAARIIEQNNPELKSTLLNLVDLSGSGREVAEPIRNTLEKRAALALARTDVDQSIDRRPLMRIMYALLGIVVVGCAYSLLTPKKIGPSVARALLPLSERSVATETEILDVKPGDVRILQRAHVEVTADLRGQIPARVDLVYSTRDRRYVDERIEMRPVDGATRQYRAQLSGENGRGIMDDHSYRIEAGDARSRDFQITVDEPPFARVAGVQYAYPSYMEFAPKSEAGPAIDGWEGTQVTVTATTNKPVVSAVIHFSDTEDTSKKAEEERMTVTDGTKLRATWTLAFRDDAKTSHPKFYRIQVRTEEGDVDPQPMLHAITIRPDRRPEVTLLDPTQDLEKPANAVVPLLVAARDDFKLRSVALRVQKNKEDVLFDGVLLDKPAPSLFTRPPFEFALEKLNVKPGDVVTYWVEARDNRSTARTREGQVSNTPKLSVTIVPPVPPAEAQRQLEQEKQRQNEKLEELKQKANEQAGEERPMPEADRPRDERDRREPSADEKPEDRGRRDPGRPDGQPEDGRPQPNEANPDRDPRQKGEPRRDPGRQGDRGKPGENANDPQKSDGNEGEGTGRDARQQKFDKHGQDDDAVLDELRKRLTENPPKNDGREGNQGEPQGSGKTGDPADRTSDDPRGSDSRDSKAGNDGPGLNGARSTPSNNPTSPDSRPGDEARPPNAKPGESPPNDRKPGESPMPGDSKPGETRPDGNAQQSPAPGNRPQANDPSQGGGEKVTVKPDKSQPNEGNRGDSGAKPGEQKTEPGQPQSGKPGGDKPQSGKPGEQNNAGGKPEGDLAEKGADPKESKPDASRAGETQAGKPTSPMAGNRNSGDPKPGDPKPGDGAKPNGSDKPDPSSSAKPGAEKPTAGKPGDSRSGEPKPGDAKPGESAGDKPGSEPGPGETPDVKKSGDPLDKGDPKSNPEGDPQKKDGATGKAPDKGDGEKAPKDGVNGPADSKKPGQEAPGGSEKGTPGGQTSPDSKPAESKPGERGSSPPQSSGSKPPKPGENLQNGEQSPAADSPDARKTKGTGDEKGTATPDNDPDADPTRARNPLDRKPGEKPVRRPGEDDAPPNRTERREGNDPAARSKPADPADPRAGRPNEPRDERPTDDPAGQPTTGRKPGENGRPSESAKPSSKPGDPQSGQPSDRGQPGDKPGQPSDEDGAKSGPDGEPAEGKPGAGKPGEAQNGQSGKPGDGKPGDGKPQDGSSDGGKPGQGASPGESSGQGNRPGDQLGKGGTRGPIGGGGNANGGRGRDGASGSADGEGGDAPNLEDGKKAANLVLRKLQDQLDRGQVDQDLLNELGWTEADMRRFADRLRNQLDDPGADPSPAAQARRRQFEESLKNLGIRTGAAGRKAPTNRKPDADLGIGPRKLPVPAEYREAYEAYTKELSKRNTAK